MAKRKKNITRDWESPLGTLKLNYPRTFLGHLQNNDVPPCFFFFALRNLLFFYYYYGNFFIIRFRCNLVSVLLHYH